jgi:hypothetical protein
MHNGRRFIDYRAAWKFARTHYAALVNQHAALLDELAHVKLDRDRLLAALIDLQNAVRNRERAQAELNYLYRERDIQRAQAAERGDAPLQ